MIRTAILREQIFIDPFDEDRLGPNSYDVTLGDTLMVYRMSVLRGVLDCAREHLVDEYAIPLNGAILNPGVLYLAATREYTRTDGYVPYLDGKSSIGRLGINIHCTAGRGDNGFAGHWTMEITVVHPVRVYAGMPIAQLTFHECHQAAITYDKRASSKYNNRDPKPQPSRMFQNFPLKETT